MLRSCVYCGKLHDENFVCEKKKQVIYERTNRKKYINKNKNTEASKFRSKNIWAKKRNEIRERDLNCCRICLSQKKINTKNLSVHHIVPIEKDYDLRLENSNLITLCQRHHEEAEAGVYSREELRRIISIPPVI